MIQKHTSHVLFWGVEKSDCFWNIHQRRERTAILYPLGIHIQ